MGAPARAPYANGLGDCPCSCRKSAEFQSSLATSGPVAGKSPKTCDADHLQYSFQRLCPTLKALVATHRICRGSGSGSNSRLKLPKLMTSVPSSDIRYIGSIAPSNDRFMRLHCTAAPVKGCAMPALARRTPKTRRSPPGRRRTSLKGGNRGMHLGSRGSLHGYGDLKG